MQKLTFLTFLLSLALSSASPLFPSTFNLKDNSQLPINLPSPGQTSTGTTTLEVEGWWIFGIPAYITPIAVGTPNQVFRVYLDLGLSGLLVRALDCGANNNFDCGYGGDQGFVYNSSASSTYEDGREKFEFMLPATHVRGEVDRDDVKLNSLELENVTLGAVDEFYGENFFLLVLADIADGALGLSPPNATAEPPYSKHSTPNIISHLLNDSSLTTPLLTFSLPPYGVERGAITLGSLPSGHEEVDLSISFGDLSQGWNLPLSSLTLASPEDDNKNNVQLDVQGWKLYPTFDPNLVFPHNLTQTLYTHLHALPDTGWDNVREFNCSFRGKLPDIRFDFDDDVSVALSEAEYTVHGWLGEDEVCLLTITEHEKAGLEQVVAVGTQLWDKWHVVFDLGGDVASMGLIEREQEEEEVRVKGERDQSLLESLRRRGRGE